MKVAVLFTSGFEEIEGLTIVDILRRAGISTDIVGTVKTPITGAHHITILPDISITQINKITYDAVILPGGSPGYKNLAENEHVISFIKKMHQESKLIAAICASPYVLAKAGILNEKKATIYPGMEDEIKKGNGTYVDDLIVIDDNIVTSKGPATSMLFSLTLVEILTNTTNKNMIGTKLLFDHLQ